MASPIRALQAAASLTLRAAAMPRVSGLRRVHHPMAPRFADALSAALTGALAADEAALIRRIERIRTTAQASTEVLTVIDYGAGSPKRRLYEAEESARGVVQTRTLADTCKASKPPFWCQLLFHLVRQTKPALCLELGTCLGISASYLGSAQRLNGHGRTITMEGAPVLAERAASHVDELGLDHVRVIPGRFADSLPAVLATEPAIDWVFIDGHHDEVATLQYFEQIRPKLTERAVVVFDDIAWSPGMRRAWSKLVEHPAVEVAMDLRLVGVCAVAGGSAKPAGPRAHLRIPLI